MNFLDEATIHTNTANLAKVKATASPDDEIHVMDEKKGKDLDGDGDIDSDDYLAARDAAIKKAKEKNQSTNEVISLKDFKSIKPGTKVTTQGNTTTVLGNDGFVLKLKNGMTVNYAQFNRSGIVKEAKDIELPADTTFTLDLKHLVQKHMNKGNDKESAIKFTKALMKKLHDKGEVEVDGTKILFKEADVPMDTQLALPEPDAPDYLGDDGMDYEGGMAKSQMLKMKKYAVALCDMVDDESQLESWVQAKITKASDYMSSVFHYLDYQKSKMNDE